jgi:hypothetical protein
MWRKERKLDLTFLFANEFFFGAHNFQLVRFLVYTELVEVS